MNNQPVKIDGLQSLEKCLKGLPASVSKKVVRSGLRKSAKPLVKKARQLVAKDQRVLEKSIGVITGSQLARSRGISAGAKQSLRDDKMAVFVAPRLRGKYKGFYGHILEFGTVKMAAQPFMRPAWEHTKTEVENIFIENIGDAVHRHFQKTAPK